MEKLVRPARLTFLSFITAALVVVMAVTLYKLQIIEGRAYYEESRNSIPSLVRVPAARGSIMDRYGRVLVENRVCNNLLIDESELFGDGSAEAIARANATILELVNTITEFGDTYTDTMPITKSPPFEYTSMNDVQRVFLNAYIADKEKEGLVSSPSAVELMAYMRDRYQIDNSYTAEETRIIAGVRYEINGRYSHGFATSDYIFAQDVSMDLIATLMERNIPGFDVETSFIRDYDTGYASHILGYTGSIIDTELEKYKEKGYGLDAQVGREGAELAFEEYLHGTDGTARITRTSSGVITSTVYTEETIPGNHVYLTLDIGLQEAAENALSSYITKENMNRAAKNDEIDRYGGLEKDRRQLITGGAVAAVNVKTGEPLCLANWPTYTLDDLMRDWAAVTESENDPLYNRVLMGTYAPGSTFKPCMAMAALCEGKIATTTPITCTGLYMAYAAYDYTPACWIYSSGATHGTLTVQEALTHSCNIFFYTLGDYLHITLMAKYAKLFGLGEATGIELYENLGQMTSDELYMERYGREVYNGETIAAAIGQAESEFTPLQSAEYCAAIANGGYRHAASILKNVYTFDFSEQLYTREPELLSVVGGEQEYYDAVHAGMYGVANDPVNGAAYTLFSSAPYSVAAKTGTAQTGEGQTANGMFICYAPYEDPEIAVAVAVEKGGAGAAIAAIARDVLDYYFSFQENTDVLEHEGMLLR